MIFSPYFLSVGRAIALPFSPIWVRIFPGAIEFFEGEQKLETLTLSITGPISKFLVRIDPKSHLVTFSMNDAKGYFSLELWHEAKEIHVKSVRGLSPLPLGTKLWKLSVEKLNFSPRSKAQIHLGSFKKENFDLLSRALDPAKILPLWHKAGNFVASQEKRGEGAHWELLKELELEMMGKTYSQAGKSLLNLFSSLFEDYFVPKEDDARHFHLTKKPLSQKGELSHFLSLPSMLLEKMLLSEGEDSLFILPRLFKEIETGKAYNLSTTLADIDMHWRHGRPYKIAISPKSSRPFALHFSPEWKSATFGLLGKKGEKRLIENGERLALDPTKRYYVERFER